MSLLRIPKGYKDWQSFASQLSKELLLFSGTVETRLSKSETLPEWNSAPTKPVSYKLYFADGSNWDPGSGRGVYCYDPSGPTWRFLG